MSKHKAVLLEEAVRNLNLKEESVVVDATLGSGGHSSEILKAIGENGIFVGIDVDGNNIENFQSKVESGKLKAEGRIFLVNDNFGNIENILEDLGIEKVDAILADLGYSSDQLENPEYGMSFREDAPLDMRLSRKQELSAREVVNEYSEEKLEELIREKGEERFAKRIAGEIVRKRSLSPISTTGELAKIVASSIPERYRSGRIHPATKTFQAIRIEVNNELANLEKFISASISVLASGGRLAIISFHSLEDRIVKNKFRENARGCICPASFPKCVCGRKPALRLITKKPVVPDTGEIGENPRSRSAKLRVVEKT
ncbi:MAG: 16S rRNA (cytosine(1402)-N(4))-methyltransferase RsmH [Patescibacteria group bacterium]